MAEQLKVVLVGAASPQWGHKISRDIIVALSDEAICSSYEPLVVMEDVDGEHLAPQLQLAEMVAEKAGGRVKVEGSTDQRVALEGARFVVVSFAVGTLEAMLHDIEIPREYGIYMPVGDTISIGGAIRAARNIPALLSIARDIEAVGHPDAWILNLANPMSILCRALTRESSVNTIGCCHELYGGLAFLGRCLGFDNHRWRELVDIDIVGVNHCGWMYSLTIDGEDGLAKLRDYLASRGITEETVRLYNSQAPDLADANLKIDLFLRHGVLPYSGDRHNAEFFTEFVNAHTNKGADYGVLLTSPQERLVQWRGGARATNLKLLEGKEEIDMEISQEAASRIIRALALGEPFNDVGNLPYHGDELPGVPDGAVLERMVTYGAQGAVPQKVQALPGPVQEHLSLITGMIEDIVEASVNGNRALLIAALERDPLLKNMDTRRIPELVDRLLGVHREYVHPDFF
jgi:alpha-galactosidase